MTTVRFFVAISGDAPTRRLVQDAAALRALLSEEFFGPEGPQNPDQVLEEDARWSCVLDRNEHWTFAGGEPFAYEEQGEDYAIAIYPVDAEPAER